MNRGAFAEAVANAFTERYCKDGKFYQHEGDGISVVYNCITGEFRADFEPRDNDIEVEPLSQDYIGPFDPDNSIGTYNAVISHVMGMDYDHVWRYLRSDMIESAIAANVPTTFSFWESNGSQLFLFVFLPSGDVVDAIEMLEYMPVGAGLEAYKALISGNPLRVVRLWDGHITGPDPQCVYDHMNVSEYGYDVIADKDGIYQSAMMNSGSFYFFPMGDLEELSEYIYEHADSSDNLNPEADVSAIYEWLVSLHGIGYDPEPLVKEWNARSRTNQQNKQRGKE